MTRSGSFDWASWRAISVKCWVGWWNRTCTLSFSRAFDYRLIKWRCGIIALYKRSEERAPSLRQLSAILNHAARNPITAVLTFLTALNWQFASIKERPQRPTIGLITKSRPLMDSFIRSGPLRISLMICMRSTAVISI